MKYAASKVITFIRVPRNPFFEEEIDSDGKTVDNSRYFEGKKIMGAGSLLAIWGNTLLFSCP